MRFIVLFLFFGLVGCVHHPKYPATWSPLQTSITSDCSDLSGTYENRAVGDTESEPLAYMLERQVDLSTSRFRNPDFRRIDSVRFRVSAPYATADFLAGDEVISTLDLGAPKRSAECDGHVLKLRKLMSGTAPLALDAGHYRTFLYRAKDESIVMRSGASEVGVVLVVPVAYSEFRWFRFARKGVNGSPSTKEAAGNASR